MWSAAWFTQWGANGRTAARNAAAPSYRIKTHRFTLLSVPHLCVIEAALWWDTHAHTKYKHLLLASENNSYVIFMYFRAQHTLHQKESAVGSVHRPAVWSPRERCEETQWLEEASEMSVWQLNVFLSNIQSAQAIYLWLSEQKQEKFILSVHLFLFFLIWLYSVSVSRSERFGSLQMINVCYRGVWKWERRCSSPQQTSAA